MNTNLESHKGSYQFEQLEGRHVEAAYLSERAQMRLEDFPQLLKRHGLQNQGAVLEVGCGQGIRTKIIAKNYPFVKTTGIDRSIELLTAAQTNDSDNISFLEADLYQLPFPDETFDFVYARLVFMHLDKPLDAFKSLLRVLKKGGRILIEDADRDCMFFEPAPKSFRSFWDKVQEGQRRQGGDPNVGRKIAPYMKHLQMQNIIIETLPIIGTGNEIQFLTRTLLPSLNIYLQPEERQEGARAIEDLNQLALDPTATFYHFWFIVSGEKA